MTWDEAFKHPINSFVLEEQPTMKLLKLANLITPR